MAEAIDWIEDFRSSDVVGLLDPKEATLNQSLRWMREFSLGRKRILDTHFAAILHTHGVRRLLTSNPGDFAVFGVFELIVP